MTRNRFSAGLATLSALALAAGLISLADLEGRADAAGPLDRAPAPALEPLDPGVEIVAAARVSPQRPVQNGVSVAEEGYLWSGHRVAPDAPPGSDGVLALDGYLWGGNAGLPDHWSSN